MWLVEKRESKRVFLLASLIILIWISINNYSIVINTILIKRLGIEYIPLLYVSTILFSFIIFFVYHFFSNKKGGIHFLVISRVVLFFLIAAAWALSFIIDRNFDLIILFLGILILSSALSQVFVSPLIYDIINTNFRQTQLKRLLPIFSISSMVAAILSGLLIQLFIFYFDIFTVLLFSLVGEIISLFIIIKYFYFHESHKVKTETFPLKDYVKNFSFNNFVFILTCISFLAAISSYITIYQLSVAANQALPNEEYLAKYYSYFQIAISASTIVYLLTLKNNLIHKLGVMNSMKIPSVILIVGFLIVTFSFSLFVMTVFRYLYLLSINVIFSPARQFSYGVLDSRDRNLSRIQNEIFSAIAVALAGLLIFLIPHIQILAIIGLLFGILWFIAARTGVKIYINKLLYNLENNNVFSNSLESLEDSNNHFINDTLTKIVTDETSTWTKDQKLKVISTMKGLGNPNFIRDLSFILNDKEFEIRLEAINSLNVLFQQIKTPSHFAYYYLIKKIKTITYTDPSLPVRRAAAFFLYENLPREEFIKLIDEFLNQDSSFEEKIIAMRTLSCIRFQFADLLQIELLENEEPTIQAEAAANLYKHPVYRVRCEEIIHKILDAADEKTIYAGLKTLIFFSHKEGYLEKIKQLSGSPSPNIRVFASLLLSSLHNGEEQTVEAEKIARLLVSRDLNNSQYWKDFFYYVVELKNDELLDKIIDAVFRINQTEDIEIPKNIFADLLYAKMVGDEFETTLN